MDTELGQIKYQRVQVDDLTPEELLEIAKRNGTMRAENPVEKCDRLTAMLQVSHESCGVQPIQVLTSFSALLNFKEQPYQRHLKIGPDPMPLDTGWVDNPGYVIIQNKRTLPPGRQPTEEEKQAQESHRIFLGSEDALFFEIAPGRFFIGELFNKTAAWHWKIRSSAGECPATVTVFNK